MIILPSLEIVPAKYNVSTSTLLSQIPIDGTGDFTVTRATSPTTNRSTRVNALGQIELVDDNVPRLDYPLGGITAGCPALLVEPSAQNQIQQSENFTAAFHTKFNLNAFGSGSVANTTATRDPYGTNLADYIQEDSAASVVHGIIDIFAGNVSGTTYTWSAFVKAAERTIINLFENSGSGANATFNLTTGVATLNVGVSASMQNYGNGWWRCRLTYTSITTGNHNVQIRLCNASGNSSYNGTGNQGAYIFGAQLETGSVATSYIPTVASGITRAADVITDTTASGVIGQTQGTIYAEVDVRTFANTGVLATISDGTASNLLTIYKFTDSKIYFDRTSATQSASTTAGSSATYTAPTILKIAIGYKAGETRMYINGVAATAEQTATFTFGTLTKVNIGSSRFDGTFFNDRIRAAALYPTRLTDTQLALLTSPYTSYSSMASALSYTLG